MKDYATTNETMTSIMILCAGQLDVKLALLHAGHFYSMLQTILYFGDLVDSQIEKQKIDDLGSNACHHHFAGFVSCAVISFEAVPTK